MSNGINPYSYFTTQAKEIENKHQEHLKLKVIHKEIQVEEEKTFKPFEDDLTRLTWLGVLCVAALVFDFLVNSKTMGWMPDNLYPVPVAIYALIFTFFDAIISSMQAGIFVKIQLSNSNSSDTNKEFSIGEKIKIEEAFKKAKKIWRPILWGLAIIKIVLFLRFFDFKGADLNTGIIVMLVFIVIIYLILDFAGEGIYIIVNKAKFFILKNIWHNDPESIEKNINTLYNKVAQDNNFRAANLNYNGFIGHFKLPGKF